MSYLIAKDCRISENGDIILTARENNIHPAKYETFVYKAEEPNKELRKFKFVRAILENTIQFLNSANGFKWACVIAQFRANNLDLKPENLNILDVVEFFDYLAQDEKEAKKCNKFMLCRDYQPYPTSQYRVLYVSGENSKRFYHTSNYLEAKIFPYYKAKYYNLTCGYNMIRADKKGR